MTMSMLLTAKSEHWTPDIADAPDFMMVFTRHVSARKAYDKR